MNSSKRMVLQRIMAAGAMDEHHVKKLVQQLTGQATSTDHVDVLIKELAEQVRPFALEIRRVMYDDGKMYIGVANTSSDTLTAFSNKLKPGEIVFLRRTIEEIIDRDDGMVDEGDLINFRENASISEVMELLRQLVLDKWLVRLPHDTSLLTLGPRAFVELMSFLRELELKKCAICQYELLRGIACSHSEDQGCSTRLHAKCLARYEQRGLQYKCPKCKHPMHASTAASQR